MTSCLLFDLVRSSISCQGSFHQRFHHFLSAYLKEEGKGELRPLCMGLSVRQCFGMPLGRGVVVYDMAAAECRFRAGCEESHLA